jgi:hypothetical protein
MYTMSVKLGPALARLKHLRDEFEELAMTLPEQAAEMAIVKAKSTTLWQDRTHQTRDSIRKQYVTPTRWRFIAWGASEVLNYGSGEHGRRGAKYPITARSGGFLRFIWHGQTVFRKRVMHPGVKPTHFIDSAVSDAEAFMMSELSFRLNGIINAHNR